MGIRAEIYIDAFSDIIITSFESRLPKNQLSIKVSEYFAEPSHCLIGHVHHFYNELNKERIGASRFLSLIHSPRAHSHPLVARLFNFKKITACR